jgi:MarR family transcriptional regulator, organic hydroperoxide resistance regulator
MTENDTKFLSEFQKLIGIIMHRSMSNLIQFARSQGVSMTQMGALRHIHYKGTCNISDISDEMGISIPASSQLLDQLVKLDLISRRENPQDRRNKQLVITDKGRQFLNETMPTRQPWLTELAASLTPDEQTQIVSAFSLITNRILSLSEGSASDPHTHRHLEP